MFDDLIQGFNDLTNMVAEIQFYLAIFKFLGPVIIIFLVIQFVFIVRIMSESTEIMAQNEYLLEVIESRTLNRRNVEKEKGEREDVEHS